MKIYKVLSIVSFCFIQVLAFAQNKDTWISDPVIKQAHVGYEFRDLKTGKIVRSFQKEKLLNPASTIKLLTSFIFLDKFGENHRFKTWVSYRGHINKDGTLEGDVIIGGNGDPSFGSLRYGTKNGMAELMNQIVTAIQKKGITCIEGNIVVDASEYGSDCTPHTWQFNDLGNYYASGVWNININENAYKLNLSRSTNRKKGVSLNSISPQVPGLTFVNELTLGAADSGDQAYIFCAPYQSTAYVRGSIPVGKSTFSIRGAIPNAPSFFAKTLANHLDDIGINSISTKVLFNKKLKGKQIWEHEGIKASKQAKSAIKKSINLYCEAFLRKMGDGSREKGIDQMIQFLLKEKIINSASEIQISDGSGLSQRNFISPHTMVNFLENQWESTSEKFLKNYLARSGYSGTLKNAFKTKKLKGKIYGKSGSMGGVRAYTGILKTKKGNQVAFSIMVNNYTSKSRDVYLHIQKLLEDIYDEE